MFVFYNRDLTQRDGCKTQDGRMTKTMSRKTGNAQSRSTFLRHSAVLSLTAVRVTIAPGKVLRSKHRGRGGGGGGCSGLLSVSF